ncbi:ABC transporter G family member 22-like isoform X2 [Ipomoea triloba]|uniref:ABC transporter G family member 22-like isoform X2 n=1 Tax=Ipomoea triloba TaxID=35885 RepID=UPI00125D5D10|nr:ABC transporter G family member 22-like isoform X2 [Ipomoea triloba]
MEQTSSTSLLRTKSDQLVEAIAAAKGSARARLPRLSAEFAVGAPESVRMLSRKPSRRLTPPSPGGGGANNTHIRKSRSAQMKLDLDELSSGSVLSRASSASLGFSFTGFSVRPDESADSKAFSDDENSEDLEAGTKKKRSIQAEPTLPIYLKFTEVSYKIVIKGVTFTEEKDILNGITGAVDPGEVLALMGPSGCGKTTLLSLLGGRIRDPTAGSITYNQHPYSKLLKSRIGFVTQDDILFPHLTVKETMIYAARLRLPRTLAKEEKDKRAMDVIYELGLDRCQDTMIGGSFVRGVSGGERKRVCIGNEIIINPSLLFLDEPTSGLDSTTALRIVDILHEIAEAGKTVITTIHQPSSRLFHKFDKLILLEFLLDLANGNINDVSVPSELDDKLQTWNSMEEPTRNNNGKPSPAIVHEYLVGCYETRVAETEKKKLLAPVPAEEELKSKVRSMKREWGASWSEQYVLLFHRGIKERWHDYFSWLRITQVIATALILGMLWWQSGGDSPSQLQDQAGLLFFIAVFWGFFPVFTAIFTFPQEKAMLSKERAADMYRLSAYFAARTTSDLPLDLLLPLIFLLVVYFMAGLKQDASSFLLTAVTVFLCIVVAQGLGLAIGATLMDLKKATTLASVTVMTFMLAGGYFIKKVPGFIVWLRDLSFNYHTFKLLLKVQYEHKTSSVNGVQIDSGVKEVGALAAMAVAYRLLAYISLRRMKLQ